MRIVALRKSVQQSEAEFEERMPDCSAQRMLRPRAAAGPEQREGGTAGSDTSARSGPASDCSSRHKGPRASAAQFAAEHARLRRTVSEQAFTIDRQARQIAELKRRLAASIDRARKIAHNGPVGKP